MNRSIYLDYNASTPLDPRVAQELIRSLDVYGNPSSIHRFGGQIRQRVDDARVRLARLLTCDHRQIVFTSGGTEANNLAIFGAARANSAKGKHLITSAIEHSSVLNAFRQLQREGFDVTYVRPDANGVVSPELIREALRPDTILMSIMMANNEVGTLQPIAAIAALGHERGIIIHTDAIQALGKVPVSVKDLDIDLLSISAHKIYGPKGVGALFHSAAVELLPLLRGGSHEGGLRAGTENVPAIHGFGVAADLLVRESIPDLLPLREQLEIGLASQGMTIVCKDAPRLPNTVNFYSEAWLGESMVMALDLEGIALSNGSACSAGVIEPSHVILALGYNEEIARSVIRVSVGKFTRPEDIDSFLHVMQEIKTRAVL